MLKGLLQSPKRQHVDQFMQDARAGLRRGHRTKVAAYSRPCLCLDTHLTRLNCAAENKYPGDDYRAG